MDEGKWDMTILVAVEKLVNLCSAIFGLLFVSFVVQCVNVVVNILK